MSQINLSAMLFPTTSDHFSLEARWFPTRNISPARSSDNVWFTSLISFSASHPVVPRFAVFARLHTAYFIVKTKLVFLSSLFLHVFLFDLSTMRLFVDFSVCCSPVVVFSSNGSVVLMNLRACNIKNRVNKRDEDFLNSLSRRQCKLNRKKRSTWYVIMFDRQLNFLRTWTDEKKVTK